MVAAPRCSKFYMLPKIHKPGNPGRPIVSACSCPTELISHYLDGILQTFVSSLPTFIKDTNHALRTVNSFRFDKNCESPLLFTMDVKSLYTVIPNDEGLKALSYFLEKRLDKTPTTTTLLRLAELVLTLKCFQFGNRYFNQIAGVSMGTRMGPSYACLFVGYIEEMIVQSYDGVIPELYKRFIDDIFGATSMSRKDLERYIDYVKNFHPALDFTFEISDTSVSFLDAKFSVCGDQIVSTIFYKATDSHAYLMYSSNHSRNCVDSIPYSQFLRLRRLCSSDHDFYTKAAEMKNFFIARDYPSKVIDRAFKKVHNLNRESLLSSDKPSSQEHRIPLVLQFHPEMTKIPRIIHKNWHYLSEDEVVGVRFSTAPITCYRRGPNIKELLNISDDSVGPPGTFTCGRSRCLTCAHVFNTSSISGPHGTFYIKDSFLCTSSNVVYSIVCTKCSMIYIGETKRRLADRFREHLRAARIRDGTSEVGVHFSTCGHSTNDMIVTALKQFQSDLPRKLFEHFLINKLGTIDPYGINRI